MSDVVCGLDFGTSNSTLALMRDAKPFLVPLERGRDTIPSAIFYSFEDDTTLFGQTAIDEYVQGAEGRLMRSLKSILGTALMDERTLLRKRSVAFTDVIADFLRHIKTTAEAKYGVTLRDVVAGRPVHFVDDDSEADRRAERAFAEIVRSVGFRKVEFQYEPIAAALQYASTRRTSDELSFIVDIGGGTSDFSIVKLAAGLPDCVLATHGVHLGGTDIDRVVSLDTIMPLLGAGTRMRGRDLPVPIWLYNDLATWHKINGLYTNQVTMLVRQIVREAAEPALIERLLRVLEQRRGHALLGCAEAAKIKLSEAESVSLQLAKIGEDLALDISSRRLRSILKGWIEALDSAVLRTLDLGRVEAGDIGTVFLTGGTTLSPIVRDLVERAFPTATVVSGDNFGAVGLGLALDAGQRFGL